MLIYDGLALEAWTQRREREREKERWEERGEERWEEKERGGEKSRLILNIG